MLSSSRSFERCLERNAGLEHRPEHTDAPTRQGDDRLVVVLSFAPLAVIEGLAVGMRQRAEGGLIEHAFQPAIAARRPSEKAHLARLAQDGRNAGSGGQRVGGAKPAESACLCDELGGEHDPHARQAAHEGRIRVAIEQLLELAIDLEQPCASDQGLGGQFPNCLLYTSPSPRDS